MPTPPVPTGDAATERPPEGTPATSPAPDVAGAIKDALGPVVQRLGEVSQGLANMQQRLDQPPKAAPPAPTGTPVDRLVADPNQYIDERARDLFNTASQTTLTPWMRSTTDATVDHNLAAERTRVDSIYGAGTFDELAAGPARQILANMPIQSQVDPRTARGTVQTVLGDHVDKLVERKMEVDRKAKEAPLELLRGGGGTGRRGESPISPDESTALDEWNANSSYQFDAKTYALARDTKSVKDWAAKAPRAKAS